MKKSILTLSYAAALLMLPSAFPAAAEVPADYYSSLEGKSGVELKKAVKELIAPHTVIDYGSADPGNTFHPVEVATWTVFAESDIRDINGYDCWWDMYSANNRRVSDGNMGLNIEHSVANSWWGGKEGSKEAYSDLHHLNPSNSEANNRKSNNPLGEVFSATWTNGVTTLGTPSAGLGGGSKTVFEPYDSYKGDFARAYFYIFTIYDDIPWKTDSNYGYMYDVTSDLLLQPWAFDMLLSWNAADPVSMKEADRNEVIYKYQENRNPFIDCPQLADHIWGSRSGEPFHYELYTPGEDDPEQYPGWDEAPVEMRAGQWNPVLSASELTEDYDYFIVAPLKNRVMTYTLITTGSGAINESQYSPERAFEDYPDMLTGVPLDIATLRLLKVSGGWNLAVYDGDNQLKGYLSVTAKNSAKILASPSTGSLAKIDVKPDRTDIIFNVSGTDYTLKYNAQSPRFAAYTSAQSPVQLYREADEYVDGPGKPDTSGIGNTGLEENAPEVITAIYDINGRKVNATSVMGLEKGIYIVVSNHGTKKIKK